MARTLKELVEIFADFTVPTDHSLMAWIVEHSATLFNLFTLICQRTDVRLTESSGCRAISTQLSPGELVVPSPVFHVLVALVPPDQAKVPSVTCAVRVACSPHLRPGESGTRRLTRPRRDTPLHLPSLPPLLLP